MERADIDPLLLHQLIGRAGRPGYETVGYCVFVGCGAPGYEASQALLDMKLPPVVPYMSVNPGDVLRALRMHRCVLEDYEPFDAVYRAKRILSEKSRTLYANAVSVMAKDPDMLKRTCAVTRAALAVEAANEPLLVAALRSIPSGCKTLIFFDGRAGFTISPDSPSSGIPLANHETSAERSKVTLALQDFNMIQEVREAIGVLSSWCPVLEEEKTLANITLNQLRDERYIMESVLWDEYVFTLSNLQGFVSNGVLTDLGVAACELRTCSFPHLALQAFLTVGSCSSRDIACFASIILGDGGGGEEDSNAEAIGLVIRHMIESLSVHMPLTARCYQNALLDWMDGASLHDIVNSEVPVGLFCRHLIRVADCLEELGGAATTLGLSRDDIDEALSSLRRGLPFIKRGEWKLR
jgi:hypothetical protein